MNNESTNVTPDTILDLRGIACPLNFVKTKIQLEKMQTGERLEVFLDSGEAIESLPPSVIEEGHVVLTIESVENYFKVLIRKN
jgi:TusA-related sulfurtransferase